MVLDVWVYKQGGGALRGGFCGPTATTHVWDLDGCNHTPSSTGFEPVSVEYGSDCMV